MELLQRVFPRKRIVPLHCDARTVVELMQESMEIGAPVLELKFRYNGESHYVGVASHFSQKRGFYGTTLFLDEQRFDSLYAFVRDALVDGEIFASIHELVVLRDWNTEYSWVDTLLAEQRTS